MISMNHAESASIWTEIFPRKFPANSEKSTIWPLKAGKAITEVSTALMRTAKLAVYALYLEVKKNSTRMASNVTNSLA